MSWSLQPLIEVTVLLSAESSSAAFSQALDSVNAHTPPSSRQHMHAPKEEEPHHRHLLQHNAHWLPTERDWMVKDIVNTGRSS